MSKNALYGRFPARHLVTALALAASVAGGACSSASGKRKCGPEAETVGGLPSWCDWEVVERSGPEPEWKDEVSNAKLEFFGEGFGATEAEARENAENHMRTQVARYIKTEVSSTAVIVWTDASSQGGGKDVIETDENVCRMAVSDWYWERRKRIGYQHGVELEERGYRVLVKGTAPE